MFVVVVGCLLLVEVCHSIHSVNQSQRQSSTLKALYSRFNLSCILFRSSLSFSLSQAHTHILVIVYIPHGHLRTPQCSMEPMQHTVVQSTDHLLIQLHENIHIHLIIHLYTVITTGTRYHTTTHKRLKIINSTLFNLLNYVFGSCFGMLAVIFVSILLLMTMALHLTGVFLLWSNKE